MRSNAPWTEEQVNNLNEYQAFRQHHPFTCGTKGCNHVSLVATKDGWTCPNCKKWVQTWAHDFMADGSWKQGYEQFNHLVKDPMNRHTRPISDKRENIRFNCVRHVDAD